MMGGMTATKNRNSIGRRVLLAVEIEPRNVNETAEYLECGLSTARSALRKLRDAGLVYVVRWGLACHNPVAYFAAGSGPDAPTPDLVQLRTMAANESRKAVRKTKEQMFDPSQRVPCYGVWGMA
jgi:hypothetical protein